MGEAREPDVGVPVFVGGLNRTGTTLMARVLGSHSALAVPPSEFLFFGKNAGSVVSGRQEFERRLLELLAWPRLTSWQLDSDEVLEGSRTWPPTARSLFLLPLDAYRRRIGKARIGEKSVLNEFRSQSFQTWFEDYRLVQMIRDPIAAYASSYGGWEPSVRRAVRWSRLWVASAALGVSRTRTDPRRHRLVRYEDLTADPRQMIREITDFLGIDVEEDAMLALADFESKDNSNFAVSTHGTYDSAIRLSDGVDRSEFVHSAEQAAVAAVSGESARALGYQPDAGRRTLSVSLALLAERVRSALALFQSR